MASRSFAEFPVLEKKCVFSALKDVSLLHSLYKVSSLHSLYFLLLTNNT